MKLFVSVAPCSLFGQTSCHPKAWIQVMTSVRLMYIQYWKTSTTLNNKKIKRAHSQFQIFYPFLLNIYGQCGRLQHLSCGWMLISIYKPPCWPTQHSPSETGFGHLVRKPTHQLQWLDRLLWLLVFKRRIINSRSRIAYCCVQWIDWFVFSKVWYRLWMVKSISSPTILNKLKL